MKRYSIIVLIILTAFSVQSQFAEDALRMSQIYYQGTARSMAIGGAIGSIGADFSSASINPAGMGLYRRGAFSITPEVASMSVSSLYNGTPGDDNRTIFNLSNFGYVVAKPLSSRDGWKYFQFGFGMNRTNNFNSAVYMQGENTVNSKLDLYAYNAYGVDYEALKGYDPYELYPAWELFLLDTIPGTYDEYYTPVPFGGVLQQQSIITKGSTNEWLFSFSGNYNEKLFVGATIGLPYTRYFRESTYSEIDIADTIPYFNSWSVTENLSTSGWGINLKLGLIYKPTDWLRLGGAFHTPTYFYGLTDRWNTTTTSDLGWFQGTEPSGTDGVYDYRLSTPLRAIGSASVIIAQRAFVSFDYEYADYSTAKFSARDYGFNETNRDIKQYYQATHNFRGGIEYRYSNFSFRGGYALYASPYANNLNDGQRTMITGGIGYRSKIFALDFAYVHSTMKEDYYMYTNEYITSNAVENEYKGQQFVFSIKYFLD